MLNYIFEIMTSSGILKYFGAFLWGISSVILSPCGIGIIPLVVGYVSNIENPTRIEAFKISIVFCIGIILNLMLIAFIMSSFGYLLGGYERYLTILAASVFILMGLQLTGITKFKFRILRIFHSDRNDRNESQSLKGALILGIFSGLSVGSCNIAYVSPILTISMSLASNNFYEAIFLILSYAFGYSFVLVISGTFSQIANSFLQSEKGNYVLKILNIICGIALIISGIYLLNEMRFFIF